MRFACAMLVAAGLLPACGCAGSSQPAEAATQNPPATNPPAQASDDSREAKHPVVRALLEALNGTEGEEADLRSVRQALYDADEDLVRVSGDNLREAILRANEKPPTLLIYPEYQEPVAGAPGDEVVPDASAPASEPTDAAPPVDAVPRPSESPPPSPTPADDPFAAP